MSEIVKGCQTQVKDERQCPLPLSKFLAARGASLSVRLPSSQEEATAAPSYKGLRTVNRNPYRGALGRRISTNAQRTALVVCGGAPRLRVLPGRRSPHRRS